MGDFITTVGQYFQSLEAPDGVEREGLFLPFSLGFAEQASLDALDKVFGLL